MPRVMNVILEIFPLVFVRIVLRTTNQTTRLFTFGLDYKGMVRLESLEYNLLEIVGAGCMNVGRILRELYF